MHIASTPPIDWGAHAERSAARRTERSAGEGAVRERTQRPAAAAPEAPAEAAAGAVRERPADMDPTARLEAHIEKMQPRIDRLVRRLGTDLGEQLAGKIEALQQEFLQGAGEGSYRAAVTDVIRAYRTMQAGGTPTETGDPIAGDVDPVAGDVDPVAGDVDPVAGDVDPVAGDVDPVAGDVDPVAGDVDPVGGVEEPVTGPPDLLQPVIPPETQPVIEVENPDVYLLGAPDES